jgi:hypothetical protein
MSSSWHGRFLLPVNSAAFWRAGPFQLWAKRSANEWTIASMRGTDAMDRTVLVEVPSNRSAPPAGSTVRRYGYRHSPDEVFLTPVLADRAVVVSPEEPLFVPPLERITVFISTPVWVELKVGSASPVLVDEPTHRPTDTWFGPSPMKGELCYATKTAARMNLDNVPVRPHRVISVVEINNRASSTLTVEGLKIPAMHQSVYATKAGGLWTETVTLDHREDDALANVQLGEGPPRQATDAILVRGPREPMAAGVLTRVFGRLVP